MTWPEFTKWIYPALAGAISALIVSLLLLPSKWGEMLIKGRIDKSLEEFKSSQTKEVEQLKGLVAHLGDRGKRANELEFSAIETIWEKSSMPICRLVPASSKWLNFPI